jgi:superfamily II DNA/RNA helicase
MTFEELKLNETILEAISYMGFEKATPIQEFAIPEILKGKDIIACAQTGTGKTAAFILPVLNKIIEEKERIGVNTLVVVPTRELAVQIDNQIQGFAYFAGINSVPIYGGGDGADWAQQRKALESNTDIIVATPGKLISHLNLGYVKFQNVKHLILDEADRMLDMGFMEDIKKIISFLPEERQNLMFSATMPSKIRTFAKKILKDPAEVSLAISKPAAGVLQAAYLCYDNQKTALINTLIRGKENCKSILVFTSTRRKVNEIVRGMKNAGYDVAGISSDLKQQDREDELAKFRSKKTRIIVATDVLSRGIDIKDINLVINYDVPNEAADYVHRIGRTARADTTGLALTLINEDDMYKFDNIQKLIEDEVRKIPMPAEFGEGPEWNPKFRKDKRRQGGGGRGRGNSSRGKSSRGGGNRSGGNRGGGNRRR